MVDCFFSIYMKMSVSLDIYVFDGYERDELVSTSEVPEFISFEAFLRLVDQTTRQ